MNMVEKVPVKQGVKSFKHMPSVGIAVSYGRFVFSYFRILLADFQSGWASLQSYQQ